MKIICVVGARPNFVKIAPLIKEIKKRKGIDYILVHTGQHYDFKMSGVFFKDLDISSPDYNLEVGPGSHSYQIGEAMMRLEKVVLKEDPDLMVVVGDANSCLIGALVSTKLNIPVAHIEAGLRSFNRRMPEEINRILTDHVSSYLFATEPAAVENLLKEGIDKKKIFYVGNIMIDSFKKSERKVEKIKTFKKLGLEEKKYAVLTLHRPENVDDKEILSGIIEALRIIQEKIKIVWPAHFRTQKNLKKFNLLSGIKKMENFKIIPPIGYLEMLSLLKTADFVLTDSGGVQEEATVLGVSCLTLRKETERPVTVDIGTNKVIGIKKKDIIGESLRIIDKKSKNGKIPKFWDGKTAERIIKILKEKENANRK
jgi:UDP-N-acetylglucosamine 2-epimerase (non-hydrolysing)